MNGQPAGAGFKVLLTYNTGQSVSLTTDATGSATYTVNNYASGSYSVSASFAGNSDMQGSSAFLTEVVASSSMATALNVTPSPAYQGQTVILTATVSTGNGVTPAGTVSFSDGTTVLGNATLNTTGVAILTTNSLAAGGHSLTASYLGSGTGPSASSSSVVPETILPTTFTVSLSPSSIIMANGKSASAAIQLASVGSFAGQLTLSYGTLLPNATATLGSTTVSLTAGGSASSTITINTAAQSTNTPPALPGKPPALIYLAAFLLCAPLARRRHWVSRLGMMAALFLAMHALSGCGTTLTVGSNTVTPGTYLLPITATNSSSQVSQTATLTITVTQ